VQVTTEDSYACVEAIAVLVLLEATDFTVRSSLAVFPDVPKELGS
jgi:hypothetical protein